VVKLNVDLPQDLYDCLDEMAKRDQRKRGGGRASKSRVIRELIEKACKGGEQE